MPASDCADDLAAFDLYMLVILPVVLKYCGLWRVWSNVEKPDCIGDVKLKGRAEPS